MAALRERHSARDGMGHADRPRLHHAFSLDAQSRGLRLSLAGRRHSQSYSNTDINTYRYTDSNSHCDGKCTPTPNLHPHRVCADAEAASYAAAAAVARN